MQSLRPSDVVPEDLSNTAVSRPSRSKPRMFIADPVCVLDYGHNPASILHFSRYFASRGYDVRFAVCRGFRATTEAYGAFEHTFGYYYQRFIPLDWSDNEWPANQRRIQEMLTVLGGSPNATLTDDFLELTALSDWLDLRATHNIDGRDTIFMPSADYYGACGLIRMLLGLPAEARPKVHLRLIGVMENSARGDRGGVARIRKLLRHLQASGGDVSISAESASYASKLSQFFGRIVPATLYPLESRITPLPGCKPFVVYSAGAGREDKGFLRLLPIIRHYGQTYPEHEVTFCIQTLAPREELRHASYCSQLYAHPNVKLIDASQPDAQMHQLYRNSSLLILPYDPKTYRQRGSAVAMEAVSYGRPLAITANTGFQALVDNSDNMFSATSVEEFCAAISRVYQSSPADIHAAALRDFDKYQAAASRALDAEFRPHVAAH